MPWSQIGRDDASETSCMIASMILLLHNSSINKKLILMYSDCLFLLTQWKEIQTKWNHCCASPSNIRQGCFIPEWISIWTNHLCEWFNDALIETLAESKIAYYLSSNRTYYAHRVVIVMWPTSISCNAFLPFTNPLPWPDCIVKSFRCALQLAFFRCNHSLDSFLSELVTFFKNCCSECFIWLTHNFNNLFSTWMVQCFWTNHLSQWLNDYFIKTVPCFILIQCFVIHHLSGWFIKTFLCFIQKWISIFLQTACVNDSTLVATCCKRTIVTLKRA